MYAYPRPLDLAYPAGVLSSEGRFMRRSEVGQSESWPEGQPEGRCGAWGRASQARTRETLGIRPARNWVCHRSWLDGDRQRREIAVSQVPGSADQGFKTPRRDAERRCRVPLFPGNPGNKPRLLPKVRLSAFRLPLLLESEVP